jgi:hypothetical protein
MMLDNVPECTVRRASVQSRGGPIHVQEMQSERMKSRARLIRRAA